MSNLHATDAPLLFTLLQLAVIVLAALGAVMLREIAGTGHRPGFVLFIAPCDAAPGSPGPAQA
jgi:hypothetical protein